MSETQTVVWFKIPIVGLPEMNCQVDVNRDGNALDREGEPLPLEARLFKCGAEGRWMLGSVFLCQKHAGEVARMMDDDIATIEAAWREECL